MAFTAVLVYVAYLGKHRAALVHVQAGMGYKGTTYWAANWQSN
jgi:hypothetical protein